eukprot:2191970-Rhodomonas_salina.1
MRVSSRTGMALRPRTLACAECFRFSIALSAFERVECQLFSAQLQLACPSHTPCTRRPRCLVPACPNVSTCATAETFLVAPQGD